jgi:hypothetical protein
MQKAFCLGVLAAIWLPIGVVDSVGCGDIPTEVLQSIEGNIERPDLVEKLRAKGPAALDSLFQLRDGMAMRTKDEKDAARQAAINARIDRLDQIIDQVGRQRYCSRSRLYWYTDFEQATAAAQASGKPILSLRLLGNLDEEYSCANSRFFRTTLYANEEISKLLRENYILHWKSVRPVPKVTIDFGDGRKLERTVTGNSIHYVLTPDGEVVEALPGLYGPKAFLQHITDSLMLAKQVTKLSVADRQSALNVYHAGKLEELVELWQGDLGRIGGGSDRSLFSKAASVNTNGSQRPAQAALAIAQPKAVVESPLVRAALPLAADPLKLEDEGVWQAVAALHAEDARLDYASRELIRSQNPTATQAGAVAITKMVVEDPLLRLVRSFESSIAVDTVKNEYRLHRQIHQWLADRAYKADLDGLNERVYAELFLTPSSDPWLGLAPADTYTGLPNSGVVRSNQ